MKFDQSLNHLEKVKELIPVGSQTFSKGYKYFPVGNSPLFIESGLGATVADIDGNTFTDWICALGPITLGYNDFAVNHAIKNQLDKGIIFSLPDPSEYTLTKILCEIIPCAEMARFSKTGSEATSAAIKLARYYTGRDHIAYRGYHGWMDWYSCTTDRDGGIPESYKQYMHEFPYNDAGSLEKIIKEYEPACVIMEPVIIEAPEPGFLESVRSLCDKYNVVLIFDETVTGFRWSLGGAQQYFGVTPDLATFGKGMANGMPISAVVGKEEIMKGCEDVFFSTTFGGEMLSVAAAIETINRMATDNTIKHCWNIGGLLKMYLRDLGIGTSGYNCRPRIELPFDDPYAKTYVLQKLIENNILVHNSMVLNTCDSHTYEDAEKLAVILYGAITDASYLLETGEIKKHVDHVVQQAFRRL